MTADYLRSRLHYDPETGNFAWKFIPELTKHHKRWNKCRAGKLAGSLDIKGYWRIGIDNETHLAHRLAYLYMTGGWPTGEVDHKDTVQNNNRWSNLRDASHSENQQNVLRLKNTRDRSKGVGFDKRSRKFNAEIRKNGKRMWLGTFTTEEEAHAAYCRSSVELHGEFSRTH